MPASAAHPVLVSRYALAGYLAAPAQNDLAINALPYLSGDHLELELLHKILISQGTGSEYLNKADLYFAPV